jgi:iron complex transport system ATP-binding protein
VSGGAGPGPLLRLSAVHFSYRTGVPVLRDVSLAVEAGEGLAVLGPNGIGKSTLLAVIAGHSRPQSGAVVLAGRGLDERSPAEVARILGFVPQSEHLPFDYTCLEYALHGRAPYLAPLELPGPADVEVAAACLARVGLAGFEERSINEVSGGERQLLMIARALAQQPRLLVLDEPTSHLDLANKRLVAAMLRGLVDNGVTVVLTTHEPEVAAAASTHLALMAQGRIIRSGPLDELMTTERLSETYGVPVRVVRVDGNPVVVWHTGRPENTATPRQGGPHDRIR